MATTFKHLVRELNGWIKPLPPSLCKKLVNKALESIYDENEWAFLNAEGFIRIPASINTGLVSVTNGSNIVNVSADLKVLLDNIEADVSKVRIVNRQIRIKAPDKVQGRLIYNIEAYDSANSQLIIDPIYLGDTVANGKFEIFKSIIKPSDDIIYQGDTVSDFKSFDFVGDLRHRRRLHLDYNIDKHDPDRNSIGTPFALSSYTFDSNGNPRFEFYPYDKTSIEKIYKIKFTRKGLLLNDNDVLPQPLNEDLVLTKARIKAYEWCDANKSTKPELKGTNWQNLIALLNTPNNTEGYYTLLEKAKLYDENLNPSAYIGNMNDDWDYFKLPHDLRDTLIISF